MQIVSPIAERHLRQLHTQAYPVGGEVIEVIEEQSADGDGAQGVVAGGRMTNWNGVVLGLIRQWNEAGETAGFIL